MATFHGKDGVVKIGANAVGNVQSFTVNTSAATADASAMGDDWDEHNVGRSNWNAQVDVYWDDGDAGQAALLAGASVTFNGQPEGDTLGDYRMTGTATVTGVNTSVNKDSTVAASISLQGNGALTIDTVP